MEVRLKENDGSVAGKTTRICASSERCLGLGLLTRILADLLSGRLATFGAPSRMVRNNFPLNHNGLGYRYHELPAPFTHVGELLHNFVLQIPRQDQDIIRFRLANPFRRMNGNVRSR